MRRLRAIRDMYRAAGWESITPNVVSHGVGRPGRRPWLRLVCLVAGHRWPSSPLRYTVYVSVFGNVKCRRCGLIREAVRVRGLTW